MTARLVAASIAALLPMPALVACGTSAEPTAAEDRDASGTQVAGGPGESGGGSRSEGRHDEPTAATLPVPTTVDPAELPQTEDKPQVQSPLFEEHVGGLWDAIVADDPARAIPFFFPLAAYKQVKAMADPAADHKNRLIAQYVDDIHAWHRQLGNTPGDARYVGIDVPTAQAAWMKPGSENNKIGYYRVLASKLNYTIGGQRRSFTLASMISWRGEWYAVHLVAIR